MVFDRVISITGRKFIVADFSCALAEERTKIRVRKCNVAMNTLLYRTATMSTSVTHCLLPRSKLVISSINMPHASEAFMFRIFLIYSQG